MPSDASSAVVRALSKLGHDRLVDIGRRVGAELDTKTRPASLAEELLHAIGQPEDFGHLGMSDDEVESIGLAVGLGERAEWKPKISAEEFERLPFYSKPSYDQDVWAAVSSAIADVMADAAKAGAKPAKASRAKAAIASKAKAKAGAGKAKKAAKAVGGKAKKAATAVRGKAKTAARAVGAKAKSAAKAVRGKAAKAGKAARQKAGRAKATKKR